MTSEPMTEREGNEIIAELTNFFTLKSRLNLIFGGLFDQSKGTEVVKSDNTTLADASVNSVALYSQLNYRPLESLRLIAGAQLNMVENIDADVVPRLGVIYYPIKRL